MELFGIGKKKKDARIPAMASAPQPTPLEQVLGLRQQGLSNDQIIQRLQGQGLSYPQIFDAMNQADASGTAPPPSYFEGAEPAPMPEPAQRMSMPPPREMPPSLPREESVNGNREMIEEISEAIIDEKWDELVKDIGKIVEWKNKIEGRITSIEQEFKDLKSEFENLHKAIISKVGEYDQNITNVGTEIKAMERVFQKVLPKMTENVNELSRITTRVKGKSTSRK